ncbi:MAG: prepilin-type N-terminal cleavage/methylation domain-containing protein [Endomicrobium sp.]|jgi:prepilin-type N-terminal cleavage/methylation domain-containing protein|nr:prepilin-type N-terminal cleavage/methylation domain-containing protein [Endomicrobium sp.]
MKNLKGFTLVEFVIVIVIVGILSIIAIPIYRSYVEKTRIAQKSADIEKPTAEEILLEKVQDDSNDKINDKSK